ncbi:MAG: archease [Actinomycetota bacterium]
MRTTEEGTGASGYELLEHTADVGIRSWGPSPEAAFEQAAWALVDLLDIRGEGTGEARTIGASSGDAPGLLVDFLNELIFLHETEEMAVSGMRVVRLTDDALEAEVETVPLGRPPEGTVVKAATHHRVRVGRSPDGRSETQVFLDV